MLCIVVVMGGLVGVGCMFIVVNFVVVFVLFGKDVFVVDECVDVYLVSVMFVGVWLCDGECMWVVVGFGLCGVVWFVCVGYSDV